VSNPAQPIHPSLIQPLHIQKPHDCIFTILSSNCHRQIFNSINRWLAHQETFLSSLEYPLSREVKPTRQRHCSRETRSPSPKRLFLRKSSRRSRLVEPRMAEPERFPLSRHLDSTKPMISKSQRLPERLFVLLPSELPSPLEPFWFCCLVDSRERYIIDIR
jgi:hypothetical protein